MSMTQKQQSAKIEIDAGKSTTAILREAIAALHGKEFTSTSLKHLGRDHSSSLFKLRTKGEIRCIGHTDSIDGKNGKPIYKATSLFVAESRPVGRKAKDGVKKDVPQKDDLGILLYQARDRAIIASLKSIKGAA